ncbi:MAG: RICIN domain-containing protein [Chitinophagaceae bacterium]
MKCHFLSIAVVLILLPAIVFAQNTQEERALSALVNTGMVKQEGNKLIFKVKKASDTAQIKLMYGAFFTNNKWEIGFDVNGRYYPSRGNTRGSSPVITTNPTISAKEAPVYDVAAPNTATISARLSTADERFLQSGAFLIRTARDYRYLTVSGPEPANRSQVNMNSYVNNPNTQQWKLVLQNDGYFKIQTENGLCLTQGLVPTMTTFTNAETQLWKLEDAGDGFYSIVSKRGLYMYLPNHRNIENGGVSFRKQNKTIEERWHLIKWTNDGRRVTSFIPERHGFCFINTFNGEDIIRWGGLCGGMVYTALDYFNHQLPVPRQCYTPANQTPLQSYIYNRQNHSIWDVNEKWSELEVSYNTRANEIFRWGLQGTVGGRLEELRTSVDANISRPLGLFAGGIIGKDNSNGGRHVVLGVGYAMGRYQGDLEAHKEDLKILIYNPNQSNTMRTLVPDLEKNCFFEVETGYAWRTYFVNKRYDDSHVPTRDYVNYPEGQAEGSVRHLYATFNTGVDDLRGGNDNVNLTIRYADGTEQVFLNVNNGARWVDNSTQTVHLTLNRAVRRQDIESFVLGATTQSTVGSNYDNWNLNSFSVSSGYGGVVYAQAYPAAGADYYFRFTGTQRFNTIPALR